jgi:GTP-binding protein YchF
MALSIGIVGLPNVGKSTLFNALTKQQVLAANYPFATIDPNTGIVPVADKRLLEISAITKPAKTVPATVEFVDIAGLVKGASEGAGLGNKFLSNIKNVHAIAHLVRVFEDSNVTHVENSVNPTRDMELIDTELILKDIDTVSARINAIKSRARFDKLVGLELEHLEELLKHLSKGISARNFALPSDEETLQQRRSLFLLSDKPVIYIFNSTNPNYTPAENFIYPYLVLDVKTEMELMEMDESDRVEFMKELGIQESGLDKLTRLAYHTLGLISFFTEGPTEVRAWTIRNGAKAPEAGSAIHTDFMKKFIACDVCAFEDFKNLSGWQNAKENGKVRLEGKEYVVQDGDIIIFRHG